jgi:hypothetical protein
MEVIRMEKLYEIALLVFQKIGAVFGNTIHFPKQELFKINYNLIARYLSYETEEDDDTSIITQKIIKRINFFSEEFPFKLNKLERIITSNKIFVFGYDIYQRLTFYLKPFNDIQNTSADDKIMISNNTNLEKIDYIIYIFFIIEFVLPTLKEKYNFSDQINLLIDFNDSDADTELIRFIMHYFNSYYPLMLGRVNIVNFEFNNLKKNLAFRSELDVLDFFRVRIYY